MMTSPSVVRIAKPGDYAEVWRLFLLMHKENGQFALDGNKVEWFIQRALFPERIAPEDTAVRPIIAVIGKQDDLEAVVGVTVGTAWYTSQRHLEDFILYVDPECRRSRHARALIVWMKQQSDRLGLPLLTGVISTKRTAAKVGLYARLLEPIGGFFWHSEAA